MNLSATRLATHSLFALVTACAANPTPVNSMQDAHASTAPTAPIAAPAAPAASGPMQGADFVREFEAGRIHELWARSSPKLRQLFQSEEGLAAFQKSIAASYGAERELVRERTEAESGMALYTREVGFEKKPGTFKFLVGVSPDGTVVAFGLKPVAMAAPTTKLDYVMNTRLRLPVDGTWTVAWGGKTIEENYHAFDPGQRFAYDILVKRNGATHSGDGKRNQDYFAFGQSVRAPGAGVVVAVVDGVEDNVPGVMNRKEIAGNHVVIDHGNYEFSFIAHLQNGSVRIKKGAHVNAGDILGLCGNSGHSSEAHVHYHVQNTSGLQDSEGLPPRFHHVRVNGVLVAHAEPVRGDAIEQAPGGARP